MANLADQIICSVRDTNATRKPRTHTIEGEKYTLKADVPTPVPYRHAKHFMRTPSFIVEDGAGKRLQVTEALERRYPKAEIPPHLTVAAWEELTKEALYARAHAEVGDALPKSVGKDKLIEFLMTGSNARTAAAANRDEIRRLSPTDPKGPEDPDGLVDPEDDPDGDGDADFAAKVLGPAKNPVTGAPVDNDDV